MKTIVSALVALSVLAGIAAPASAFDAKSFYEPAGPSGRVIPLTVGPDTRPRARLADLRRPAGFRSSGGEPTGRLVSKFCGFILTRLRVSMARPRYTGLPLT